MPNSEIKVNRTTITLYRAMFSLLEENTFNDITVNDICQRAMVSRTTFYSYFEDKYKLVIFCLRQERERLGVVAGENIKENILTLLYRMQEKKSVYKNIVMADTNKELNRMIVEHIRGFVQSNLQRVIAYPEELDVLTMIFSTGYAGTILWWMENDMHIEPNVLAEYFYYTVKVTLESFSGSGGQK